MKTYILGLLLALLPCIGMAMPSVKPTYGVHRTPDIKTSARVSVKTLTLNERIPLRNRRLLKHLPTTQAVPGVHDTLTIGPVDATIKAGDSVNTKVTYYARRYENRPMANGVVFHETGDTVAFNRLPLGSVVKITNIKTGVSVIATVMDRKIGPAMDLTEHLFTSLGFTLRQGVGSVSVTVVKLGIKKKKGIVC